MLDNLARYIRRMIGDVKCNSTKLDLFKKNKPENSAPSCKVYLQMDFASILILVIFFVILLFQLFSALVQSFLPNIWI